MTTTELKKRMTLADAQIREASAEPNSAASYPMLFWVIAAHLPVILQKLETLEALECTSNTGSTKKTYRKPKPNKKSPLTRFPQNLRKQREEMKRRFHRELAQYHTPQYRWPTYDAPPIVTCYYGKEGVCE